MKKEFNLNQSTIKILYTRYKEFILPLAIIFICAFLFLKFIIPQIKELRLERSQAQAARERIAVLKENLNILLKMDEGDQNLGFQIASSALPTEKDFVGILNAISTASYKANVPIGDFTFQVGELSTKSAQTKFLPSLSLVLNIQSGQGGIKRFLSELSETLPLSEVEDVQSGSNLSTITINFYYKPLSFKQFNYDIPLKPLSSQNSALLNKISSWQSVSSSF